MVQVGLLVIIITSMVIGAVSGMALEGVFGELPLAILTGFLGVIASCVVLNLKIKRLQKSAGEDVGIPAMIIGLSVFATLIGGFAAHEITRDLTLRSSMMGAISGLLSAILMILLIVSYRSGPRVHL